MKIQRRFTKAGVDPLDEVRWEKRESVIREPDGTVVFEMRDIEVPADWSQVATDILAQKYFRKAGVPQPDGSLGRETSARQVVRRLAGCWTDWGRRYKYFDSDEDAAAFDAEISHMLIHQMAAPNSPQWFNTGLAYAYGITGPAQGHYYVDPDTKELLRATDSYSHPQPHACLPAHALVNTPTGPIPIGEIYERDLRGLQVFDKEGITTVVAVKNNGVKPVYKISLGNDRCLEATADHLVLVADPVLGHIWERVDELKAGSRLLRRFDTEMAQFLSVLKVQDLHNPGAPDILPALQRLAQTALATLAASVLHEIQVTSIDAVGEQVVYDIETESHTFLTNNIVVHNCFIQSVEDDLVNDNGIMDLWVREARLFKYGSGTGSNFSNIRAEGEKLSGGGSSSGLMSFLRVGDRAAGAIKSGGTTRRAAKMVILDADHPDIRKFVNWKVEEEKKVAALIAAGYDSSYEGEAYNTVSGQNSNNSVRISDKFIDAVRNDGQWDLLWRRDKTVARTIRARDLWDEIARAAWACADPGIQYDDIINSWHTCPAGGRIRASNPCSEYMFLDDTACNLASLNLMKFYDTEKNQLEVDSFKHATRLWTMVLEISVLMAQFPSPEIARKSYEYRTLGLGYANLGTLLMVAGIPYDSARALAVSGVISAILTGESYAASAEMAAEVGTFPRYKDNADHMLRVMRNHRRAAYNANASEYEEVSVVPMGIDPALCPPYLVSAARASWDRAVALGQDHGYRNAQATCIAPTGCLVGNSLVTTDRGIMRLNMLGDVNGSQWQDVGFNVLTDAGEQSATKFYINGAESTRRITTKSGYTIQGTLGHRIKVVDPASGQLVWKRFSDVQSNDIVALSMGTLAGTPNTVTLPPLSEAYWTGDYTTKVPRTMSAQLAELLGYFMGDGSLHSKGLRFCVTQQDKDLVEHLRCQIKELFNLDVAVSQQTGYTEVAAHSVPLVQWWEACRFTKLAPHKSHAGKGYVPRIPDAVLASNDPQIYGAFLRGLFEADGTVTNCVPSVSTTHASFADEIRTVMLGLGVPTSSRTTQSQWGKSAVYVVRVRNKFHVLKFDEVIGFISNRKAFSTEVSFAEQAARRDYVHLAREIIHELVPAGSSLHNAINLSLKRHNAISRRSALALLEKAPDQRLRHALDFFFDTVATNEDGGEQLTYDLSVPSNVTYVANGFISHNTIGLLMDCDTTGIEPDFALVKFKKLSGGGYFKIINQSLPLALRNFGYTEEQIDDIVRYAKGSGSLYSAPYINVETLRARGFTSEDIVKIEKALPTVFEIGFAFNQWTLGEPTLQRLGFTPEQYNAKDFDLLRQLGFNRDEIEAANYYICGTMTVEGAPHLKEEHYSVFDCANKCGKLGRRFIYHMGHVRMMAAAQPFISGAISKTINMPNEATVEEIKEAYMRSGDRGLRAIAPSRAGCKLPQPLSNKSSDKATTSDRQMALSEEFAKQLEEARRQRAEELRPDEILAAAQRILANATNTDFKRKVAQELERNRLPAKRRGWAQKAKIAGHTVFLRTGEYGDGTLGEIFVDMHKEGASFRSLMNCFAIAVSIGLQYGVPLEEFVDKFVFTRFEPNGFVDHPNIKHCTSVIDYIFRVLGMEYLGRTDFVQVKPEDKDVDEV